MFDKVTYNPLIVKHMIGEVVRLTNLNDVERGGLFGIIVPPGPGENKKWNILVENRDFIRSGGLDFELKEGMLAWQL